MNKKLISLLLVFVMVLGLFSVTALAKKSTDGIKVSANTESTSENSKASVNALSASKTATKGSSDVAVIVYGKTIADAIHKADYNFQDFVSALKSELQGILAGEKLPNVEMYLVSDDGHEYKLTKDAIKNASFASSIQYSCNGLLNWTEVIADFMKDAFGWLGNGIDDATEFYKVYGAKGVPQGEYTLEIRHIDSNGYTLWQPESGQCRVTVGDSKVNYVGFSHELGSKTISSKLTGKSVTAKFSLPGVFFDTAEPGFGFKSADLGGNGLDGTEFVLVNRDEVEKIVKASMNLGKDTFTNAIKLVGTDGFTWEELCVLNKDMLVWDQDAHQISFNEKQAFKLLSTYWALLEASSKMPITNFFSDETNLRLPAILRASSNGGGYVNFTEDSNITLVWSLEILFKMGNIVLDNAEGIEFSEADFDNPQIAAIVNLVIALAKSSVKQGTEFWNENGGFIESSVNDWIYPILQNDNMADYAKSALKLANGNGKLSPKAEEILDMLPSHAILTAKMPAGHYIMFESAVPGGYIRSPLAYTVNMQWLTDSPDVRNWCYATAGSLGIILPYYAEDFYTFLRDYSGVKNADKIISLLTGGNAENLIENILNGSTDVTAIAIAYNGDIIYNYMGGKYIYSSEEDLISALNEYLYANGRTKQNLLMFANQVVQSAKSVVTSDINYNWVFYNYSTSIRTNLALKSQAIIKGIADSIDASGSNLLNAAVKNGMNFVADSIDTTNYISGVTDAIKDTADQVAKDVTKAAIKETINAGKTILQWGLK